jgi:transposase InsO family protein
MLFGFANAPPTFQRIMTECFGDIEGVSIYMDDIVVSTPDEESHHRALKELFRRFHENNFKLRIDKCKLYQSEITFLGHKVSSAGVRADPAYIDKVMTVAKPTNKKELGRLLGMCNWVSRHIPNLADMTAQLEDLKRKSVHWNWTPVHDDAFVKLRAAIQDARILHHPDMDKTFLVQCDASDIAVGAVLLQQDTTEELELVPIEFLSKKFDQTQRHWHVSEKELYAVVYSLQKWRSYLLLRTFIIDTDHSNLVRLFALKGKSSMTGRLSRWALQLSEYDFIARYLRGEDNVCADFLSRGGIEMDRDMFRRVREYALILSEYAFSIQRFGDGQKEVLLVTTRKMARELEEKARLAQTEVQKNETPPKKLERKSRRPRRAPVEVKSEEDIDEELEDEEQVQQELNSQLLSEIEEAFKFLSATRSYDELLSDNSTVIDGQKSDPKLRKIYKAVMDSSAPSKRIVNTGLCSVSEGVLMYDGKMWIPESLRHDFLVLQHTHAFALHQGSERMWKQCRERYYWPKMRRDIDDFVKRCHTCQLVRDGRDKKAGVYLQFPAYEPWEIVHMDLVGPLPTTASGNRYLLTCMDRFSHYVCVTPLPDMEAHTVAIAFLDNWIYRFGVPEKVLTDNGKQFVSRVAELVSKVFGYKRVFTTAWHPETNGQLERWHLYFKRRIVAFATERGFDLTSAECDGFPWDLIAKACEAAYNSTPPKMLKVSPFELIFGTRMALPADIPLGIAYTRKNDSDGLKSMKKLLQTHLRVIRDEARQTQATYDAQRQRRALKIRREHKFAIGDMVLLYVGVTWYSFTWVTNKWVTHENSHLITLGHGASLL